MTTSTPTAASSSQTSESGGKGLKTGALGLIASIVIGIASTAPAYSLAASIGLVLGRGRHQSAAHHDPGVRPDPVHLVRLPGTQLPHPRLRDQLHLGRPGVRPARRLDVRLGRHRRQVIVLANLAQIAGIYTFKLFGADGLADSVGWVALAGSIWLLIMTYIAYRGIELSARLQVVLLALELLVLLIFSVVALSRSTAARRRPRRSSRRSTGSTRSAG